MVTAAAVLYVPYVQSVAVPCTAASHSATLHATSSTLHATRKFVKRSKRGSKDRLSSLTMTVCSSEASHLLDKKHMYTSVQTPTTLSNQQFDSLTTGSSVPTVTVTLLPRQGRVQESTSLDQNEREDHGAHPRSGHYP